MATATRTVPAASQIMTAGPASQIPTAGPASQIPTAGPASLTLIDGRREDYRCTCGHTLRVFGLGRHRVYFEPGNTQLDNPVMNRICPQCGEGLPGKNAA
jgi:hypothetical protein